MTRIELETNDSIISIETIGKASKTNNGRKSIEIYFSIQLDDGSAVCEWYMSDVVPIEDYRQCPALWDFFKTQLGERAELHFV